MSMIKEDIKYSKVSPELRQLCIGVVDFYDSKCTNKMIRDFLIKNFYPNPVKRMYILKEFGAEKIKKIKIRDQLQNLK